MTKERGREPSGFQGVAPPGQHCQHSGPECLGGGHAGGAQGGQQPGGGADDDRGAEAAGPGQRGDDHGPALCVGVDDGGGDAEDHPGGTAGHGEQDGFGEELGADVAFGGAQGAAQPDLRPAFQHGDDHDVGHADGADQQRDRAEAEEQHVEGALGVGLGGERGRGLGDVDLLGLLRVGLGGEQAVHPGRLAGDGADVDRGRPSAVLQVGVRGRVADQHRGVDLRGEERRGGGSPPRRTIGSRPRSAPRARPGRCPSVVRRRRRAPPPVLSRWRR